MATSAFFNINRYVMLEYMYLDNTQQYSTNSVGFRSITNGHADAGELAVVNNNNSIRITKNTVDNSVVEVDAGKYALIDNDNAFYYPNADPEVEIDNISFATPINVSYDKVRIHLLSGYNFDGLYGFIASLYLKMNNNMPLRLCHIKYTINDNQLLYFNPKPIKLSELIYDKYIEILVPSQKFMLGQQELVPNSPNILSYYLTDGNYLANQNTIYCEYSDIIKMERTSGIVYMSTGETTRFAFASEDQYTQLLGVIRKASDGEYFEYFAQFDGEIIENFIFRLNSKAGNNYYIIHEIRVLEQLGNTFIETQNFSSIQTSDYSSPQKFKPVLTYGDRAASFSLEYTMRLYNAVDGRSIFKTATLSSTDVAVYGKKGVRLEVGNTTEPLKVYNKIEGDRSISVQDNLLQITKTKILSTYINANQLGIMSGADVNSATAQIEIKLNPFDNLIKFDIVKYDKDGNGQIFELDQLSDYYMVFIKDDGSKNPVKEFIASNFKKTNGELAFKIPSAVAQDVDKYVDRTFYLTAKNPDGIETVLAKGVF